MKHHHRLLLFTCSVLSSFAHAENAIEEVVVSAGFRDKSLLETSASASVINAEMLRARKATHLEDVLNVIPNLNFSSGASRGRFFQIRGIGERSQFVEPVNSSVGVIVDGIDFTGVGGAATTLDIQQIEVLRGPQGTYYGANALAGLINLVSESPDTEGGYINVNLGEYNTREISQAVSGKVSDTVGMRIAFSKNLSNGYGRNTYLEREDTNEIDESTARLKLHWQANDDTLVKLTSYLVDADNGYDAFSLDNTRETLSDQPGRDRTQTRAGAIQVDYDGLSVGRWETTLSSANSDLEYSFDEDWSFRTICAEDSDCAFWQYSTFDRYDRENKNVSFDTRIISDAQPGQLSWVAGLYYRQQDTDLVRSYTSNGDNFYDTVPDVSTTLFSSEYNTENLAVYGQLDIPLAEDLSLVVGARAEQRDADYRDSDNEEVVDDESLWGGKVALEYRGLENQFIYGLVSRGYKAGSNNVPSQVAGVDELIPVVYDTEFMWNLEIGHKGTWLDGNLESQVSVFYQDREDIQIRQSLVTSQADGSVGGTCPCNFNGFTGNGPEANTFGLEAELQASLGDAVTAWASLGLLKAEFVDFQSFSHVNADTDTGTAFDLDGRDIAQAPNYQAAAGVQWTILPYLSWQIDAEAKDAFFLSPRHDVKTESYTLWNTRIRYYRDAWEVALWGKNLTDEDTIVRGFGSFGNDPRKFYVTEPYFQYGAPRVVGLSASLKFD